LQCIGIELDDSRSAEHAARISTGRVAVRVIRTDEESVIADLTARCLGLSTEK
jgi:acetate kinase